MPAATNLGSYSDRSNFFNKPASVCGCFAPPPPTLPPKIPHDAGPPSSPQEMSNMLSTGILCQRWRAVRWCACAASERMGRDRCEALRAPRLPGSSAVPGCCPKFSPVQCVRGRHPHEGRASPVLAGAVQGLFRERWAQLRFLRKTRALCSASTGSLYSSHCALCAAFLRYKDSHRSNRWQHTKKSSARAPQTTAQQTLSGWQRRTRSSSSTARRAMHRPSKTR